MASPAAELLIADLRNRGELAAADVLGRNRSACASLTDDDRRIVETLIYAVADRLLDDPRARLEDLDGGDTEVHRIAAIRELFGLENARTRVRRDRSGKTSRTSFW
jgi:glutamyl-tRNA reductase